MIQLTVRRIIDETNTGVGSQPSRKLFMEFVKTKIRDKE